MKVVHLRHSALFLVFCVASGLAMSDPMDIHRNDGVQISFTKDLRSDFNEPGDRVVARVDKDPELPKDTLFNGRIMRVHPATRYRAASMDIVFTSIRLPDGDTLPIDAVPTPENDPHLSRGSDGRLVAAYKPGDETAYVVGGTVGGLILGGIGHRPVRGAFFGALIGSIAGAFNRQANANVVVRKGEKMVALFNEDVSYTAAHPRRNDWRRYDGSPSGSTPPPPPPSAPASHSGTPDVRLNGSSVLFDDALPYRDNGEVMVPLEYTADKFNLVATIHDDGSITVDGPDSTVNLHMDSDTFAGSGSRTPLARRIQEKNGVVYAPLQLFARIATDPITVDGQTVRP